MADLPCDIKVLFGKNLKRLRKQRGLSQEQFAELLGVKQSYLSRMESGARGFTSESLAATAEKLGCQPWELLADPDIEPPIDDGHDTDPGLDDAEKAALTEFGLSADVISHGPNLDDALIILDKFRSADQSLRAVVLAVLFESPDMIDTLPPDDIDAVLGPFVKAQ